MAKVTIVVEETKGDERGTFLAKVLDAEEPREVAEKWPLAFAFGFSRNGARNAAREEVRKMRRDGDL